jgi:chromosome segregation ATPase
MFAVGLLAAACLVVFVTVAYKDATWLSGSALFALLCGVLAARYFSNELADVRRQHARDRVAQAEAYARIADERTAEHEMFVSSMSSRLVDRDQTISHLKGTVRLCESRIVQAEHRVRRETKRANDAEERLEKTLSERSDLEAEAAALMVASGIIEDAAEMPAIVNLMAWESRIAAAANPGATLPPNPSEE